MNSTKFKTKAESLINELEELINTMPYRGNSEQESQKIYLSNKLNQFSYAINGVEEGDFDKEKYRLIDDGILKVKKRKQIIINDEIIDNELFEYRITHRETLIDEIHRWVAETKSDNDKRLMLEDLDILKEMTDEYIFSHIGTNEYICSDDDNFNEICEELIKLNKTFKN